MSATVSTSVTEQGFPVPTRQERDQAYSLGAGRKAEEHVKPSVKPSTNHSLRHQNQDKLACAENLEAPVGLDLETKGDEDAGSTHCHAH